MGGGGLIHSGRRVLPGEEWSDLWEERECDAPSARGGAPGDATCSEDRVRLPWALQGTRANTQPLRWGSWAMPGGDHGPLGAGRGVLGSRREQ